ncbi:MAG: polyprenyl synthetase family protein [Spirochaetaceae bacterium]|nr:MAG: polyprenyl synthetase family protein [Spirochaetaceae bacterium]
MNQFWDDFPVIRNDLQRVQQIILENVGSGNTALSQALREFAARGGKMLRPAFVLLAARVKEPRRRLFARSEALSTNDTLPEKIYRIGAAIEMLHMATLIHDDILDEARTRRRRVALYRSVGPKAAVLMGDLLFSRCFSLVADCATMENARRLAVCVTHMCAGEIEQARGVPPDQLSERDYLRRVAAKTGLLFLLSFHVGAHENGVNGYRLQALRRVGYNIGVGFQIIDDLLDFTGNEQELGKPVAGDLRQGIYTLPVIAAIRRGQGDELSRLLAGTVLDEERVQHAVALVERNGGFTYARSQAARYTARALQSARTLPQGDVRDAIVSVTRKLLDRDS